MTGEEVWRMKAANFNPKFIEYKILGKCRDLQIGILAYSPLAQGILTGEFYRPVEMYDERPRLRFYSKNRSNTVHDEEDHEKETFETIDKIRVICDEIGEPMANLTIAWVSEEQGVSSVLVGARKLKQIISNAQAADLELDPSVLLKLNGATEELKKKMGPNADPWRTKSRIK